MSVHHLAGKPAPPDILINASRVVAAYHDRQPDMSDPAQRVAFGTSGHRGSSEDGSFNEDHILAISQAICEYRVEQGITGKLFVGADTHALSEPALQTAVEVFAANRQEVVVQADLSYVPTPVISHAILQHNRSKTSALCDGVVITPSHNPPRDGGFKYNPPQGGPAGTGITRSIQERANQILDGDLKAVKRQAFNKAILSEAVTTYDYLTPYVEDLQQVVDLDAIYSAGLKLGVDPLGGSAVHYWDPIAERYKLNIQVVNRKVDPAFSFMTVDHDGKIRMDCSSPYAMAGLIGLKDSFDVAFGNDPDCDRHGIVTPQGGLLNPNHYLAVCVWYLFQNRPDWNQEAAVGKTLVSSSMIDRVAADIRRDLCEVPVGFKWFVTGLLDGSLGFGGEESAGASFLRRDGTVWTTDKDGIILDLLAAEIIARLGRDLHELYSDLEARFGRSHYQRIDTPASAEQKDALKSLSPEAVKARELAGEPILAKLTQAPGNNQPIGGLKVVTQNGWFAARPSGTEDIYKLYAESFQGPDHLGQIQQEARAVIASVIG